MPAHGEPRRPERRSTGPRPAAGGQGPYAILGPVTSNIGQNYPYTSETEAERAGRIASVLAAHDDLGAKLASETTPLDPHERWWVWKCPTTACPGLLHVAGYAVEKHAVYVVCDGTCGKTFLR
jgi:hypothetical protein